MKDLFYTHEMSKEAIEKIEKIEAEVQRLEARLAALTAPKAPSQEAVKWAKGEIEKQIALATSGR